MASPLPSVDPVVLGQGLRFSYGRGSRAVAALRGIDLEVRGRECLGLLGANGSGKTTTLRIVLGLLRPTQGRIAVLGGPAGRRAARAATGYVPEEARRFGNLTGLETVRLFAALQGVRPRAERLRRATESLDQVGLAPSAQRQRASGYSRGMARRLALASALVHRPRLLVLDEPTSGLDPLGTEEICDLLVRHRDAGGATIVSTHDRVTAEAICDRALVLDQGLEALGGPLADLLQGDPSPSLAGLLRGGNRG